MVSKFLTALAVAGVASAAGTNVAKFHAYWGQSGPPTEKLRERCDEGADYISLSSVTSSPENNPTGYPGTDFAAHCWGTAYEVNGAKSNLLDHCLTIQEDLEYCRKKGIKMLLSIGGAWNEDTSDYRVTTDEKGREFANFLWGAFGPYDPSWKGPRPFDGPSGHAAVDGFDFDLELPKANGVSFDNKPWIAMADQFRSLSKDVIITAAPQCPTTPAWFAMKEMIQKTQFDALFVQFYNNVGCDLVNGNDDFNYHEWESIIASSDKSQNAKIFVGVPAAPNSESSVDGYVNPKRLEYIICPIAKRPSFGGISIWDMSTGRNNIVDGKSFNQHVQDILGKCGDHTTTSTIMKTTSSTNTSSTSTTSQEMVASTTMTTTTRTMASCAPAVTSCPARVFAETTPQYSTVYPVTKANQPPKPTVAPSQPNEEMTTSTVYATAIDTISKCSSSVANCPIGHETTETISASMNMCLVDNINQASQPTQPAANPAGGQRRSSQQSSGDKPTGSAAVMTLAKTKTLLSVTGPETTLIFATVKPDGIGSKLFGGTNRAAPTGEHSKFPSDANCPLASTGYPLAPVVRPTIPVTAAASFVTAGLVALVAAQIFLL